ncbi:prepilin-type N-terminal cleavage/methylation domain-containing protein [Metabacillus idriensis]|uniref:prepilin-type N-terminal cleavage/methylation domain-containing protein n=1 Tax=Metabacillus idriensis TaxID=324768 RepID=UPI00174B4AC6|nr:prepilin-type N-terminal cleavage/methylation domain-containing protein [Metabacillus idriensis]
MKQYVMNQKGISLIELLLVLALSSMVIMLGVSFQAGMFKAGNRTLNETYLRNESILIIDLLNKAMENADQFSEDILRDTELKAIYLVDIEKVYDENKKEFFEQKVTIPIEIKGNALFINGKQVSDDRYTLKDTKFFIKENQLVCTISLNNKESKTDSYEIIKIFDLS